MPPETYTGQSYSLDVAGFPITLPIVAIKPDFAISLRLVIDLGVAFATHCGQALAARLAGAKPDIIAAPATLGIPVAIEVTRALGLDRYVILQKSPKLHLTDALSQPITSITSSGTQHLLLDRAAIPHLAGKRVALVDDVIATGSSITGALTLLRRAGADIVAIGSILTEAHAWQLSLGPDDALVHSLAHIPQFSPTNGVWVPIPETE
jgi:adenine phosphoribosyltransferase